ncbi:hypothetical protein PaG_02692 [Moesziomyces aphidis]|uniref:Uncharacterized protein n=1 Tax=Moesziomyces aphidis TaxID=84754 RepID=W3VMY1_MOEAP|nr:hypothetical protein PaG_02692 [Moesziomyces aphidis]
MLAATQETIGHDDVEDRAIIANVDADPLGAKVAEGMTGTFGVNIDIFTVDPIIDPEPVPVENRNPDPGAGSRSIHGLVGEESVAVTLPNDRSIFRSASRTLRC